MNKRVSQPAVVFLVIASLSATRSDVTLPALFSDHMVLQADTTVPVWGWAEPGKKVSVSIGGHTITITADAKGNTMVAYRRSEQDSTPT